MNFNCTINPSLLQPSAPILNQMPSQLVLQPYEHKCFKFHYRSADSIYVRSYVTFQDQCEFSNRPTEHNIKHAHLEGCL